MTNSPNYNFSLYSSSDTGVTFLNYRISISGEQDTSNFMIIDTVLNEHQEAIQALQDSPSVWGVNAQYNSENFYVAGVVGYPGYQNNQIIALSLNQNNIGTVTISINSASTVSVMKYNSSGSLVNMESNDFIANNPVLCLYNGTVFIAIGVLNADTVNISGTSGHIVTITGNNTLGDSGYGIGEANGVATLDENSNVEQNANTATTANSVSNPLVINLNNQSQQSYNGSEEIQLNLTPGNIGALPADGNAATATKLATPVKIGDADFDGSADVTIAQIGVLGTGLPSSLTPATPADQTFVKNVTGGYAKIGNLVYVSVSGQTARAISGGSISVATGLPAPAAALTQGTGFKLMALPAYGLHCSGGGVTADGQLAITRAPGETYPANEDFFITGFYYTDE